MYKLKETYNDGICCGGILLDENDNPLPNGSTYKMTIVPGIEAGTVQEYLDWVLPYDDMCECGHTRGDHRPYITSPKMCVAKVKDYGPDSVGCCGGEPIIWYKFDMCDCKDFVLKDNQKCIEELEKIYAAS